MYKSLLIHLNDEYLSRLPVSRRGQAPHSKGTYSSFEEDAQKNRDRSKRLAPEETRGSPTNEGKRRENRPSTSENVQTSFSQEKTLKTTPLVVSKDSRRQPPRKNEPSIVQTQNTAVVKEKIDSKASRKREQTVQLETQEKKKVFVCVTGQIQRFVVREKIATVFKPLQEAGYDLDIALVMSEGSASFVNAIPNGTLTGPEVETWEEAADLLSDFNVLPYRIPPLTATIERMNGTFYERNLAKPKKVRLEKSFLHMKQMETLAHCMDAVPRHQDYAFHVRLRDDVALAPPLNAIRLVRRLLKTTPGPIIMASNCQAWGGMNDRMALMTPDAVEAYYQLPYQGLDSNVTLTLPEGYKLNAERYYFNMYTNANITVDRFQGLRNVFKYLWVPERKAAAVTRKELDVYSCASIDPESDTYNVEVIENAIN